MGVILLNQIFFLGILQHLTGTDLRKWWNIVEIVKISTLVTRMGGLSEGKGLCP